MVLLPAALVWLLCLASASVPSVCATRPRPNILRRKNPTYTALHDDALPTLATLTDLDEFLDFANPASVLSKLLVPRVAGSAKLVELQSFVVAHFDRLDWHTERDHFEAPTPYGPKTFTNLVFTHDPDAARRLVVAAHLDSKFFPNSPDDGFVGATDSAAPCAMMLDLASALTPLLDARKQRIVTEQGGEEGRDTQGETLQIIFFDGEEAFKDWTHEDSIYGAKHLVEKWKQPDKDPQAVRATARTPLSRISNFVLLDLLGAPKPVMRSFHSSTGWLFDEFQHAEERLGTRGLLWDNVKDGAAYAKVQDDMSADERSFFVSRTGTVSYGGGIEDDHIPFLQNGVPVVHLIPLPFPRVWHTLADDATALDLRTIKAWTLIVRLTVAEYLGLQPPGSQNSIASKAGASPPRDRRDLVSREILRIGRAWD